MAAHNTLGQKGEDLGSLFLQQKDFKILHRNWRHSYYEIDIIAVKGKVLHFIEVKLRSSKKWGWPEEAVTKKKFQSLLHAADEFLYLHPQYKMVQYDILSININKQLGPEYFFIEDVYF